MPLFSALRFLKYINKKKYLSPLEKALYVQRAEENEIAFELKRSRENFFVISGPKKVGKSAMLRHMADSSLKKRSLYIKIEQKMNNPDELYKAIAKTVGYHQFYEESWLRSMICFWKIFQPTQVDHHDLSSYLEEVGKVYQFIHKGKLPILIIDGAAALAKATQPILDDLAYMAKSLAESRSMIMVFGLLDAFGPNVLNNSGYNINKQTIFVNYMSQKEVMIYAEKSVSKDHPLRSAVLKAVEEENSKIYGGNFQYIDLLINQLQYAKTTDEIENGKRITQERVMFDIGDELKKTPFKDQAIQGSTFKISMIKAFKEISEKGKVSIDKYLSFFNKADQASASKFIYSYMILKEQNDMVSYRGPPIEYYIRKNVFKRYAQDIIKEEEIKKNMEMREYKDMIEQTIIEKKLKAKWSDLVGLDDVKQKMMETIVLPTLNPKLFTGLRSPARGVLFYGPPGNGKTMVARVVASECGKDVTFFNVSSSTFTTKSVGREPDKIIKALFTLASERQPSVIFIDEMDSILSKRGANDTEESRRLKNEFLVQFEGVASGREERVVVLGATNRPFDIDDAILRRFSVRIYLDLPSEEARKRMIKNMINKVKSQLSDREYDKIVSQTVHYSFSDLSALCREASYEPIREIPMDKLAKAKQDDIRAVRYEDFERAFKRISKSVDEEALLKLINWNKQQ